MPWISVARPTAPRRGPRAGAYALAACAAVALAAPAARAQAPVTLTFNTLTDVDGSGVRYVNNCYEEGGFRVTAMGAACGAANALATWTSDSPLFYSGSPALYATTSASVDIAAAGGGAFSLQSIGLAPLLGAFGSPASVLFTGFLAGGGTVTQTVAVPGATTALTVFNFAAFAGLSSVRMTVTAPDFEPYVQFDDVRLAPAQAAVIPEPTTVALLGAGLAGVAAAARRRRRAA
jgi:hypothetical protein